MESNRLYLFRDIRFLPIFIIQFCGCFNDSVLKNALIILVTYQLSAQLSISAPILVLFANAIFVLPFVIFASIAGQISDKYERSSVVKIIKLFEIIIILFAIYGFIHTSLVILFLSILFMGIHSTFFGPIKYSVLPDHLNKSELLGANGFVEASTFISILIGTIIGGYYTINGHLIAIILLLVAIIGFVTSYFLPKSNNANSEVKVSFKLLRDSLAMINYAKARKQLYLAILGISWFWFISAAILAQIPSLAKETFGADENVANLFLATFSIGVGVGSFWCNRILENKITTKYIFISAVGISIFGIDLFFASRISMIHYEPEQLKGLYMFLSKKHNWRILIDLFFISAIGGLYIVPLFAVLQYFSPPAHRSRIIAINNFINSIFMAGSTIILSLLFYLGCSITFVILFVSLLNIAVALYIYKSIPEMKIVPFAVIRGIFKFLFGLVYNVEVKGIENFYQAGERVVVIANHISYIDPPLLASYLPGELTFAINTSVSKALWVRPFLKMARTLPLDPTSAMAIKTLIKVVQKNKKIAIFPEGRRSATGSLMKIYEGPSMIAEKAGATILPIRIDGTQFTHFAKLRNILKTRLFPKVTITILPPVQYIVNDDMEAKEKRKYVGQKLYDIMADMMFESSDYKHTIFKSLIDSAKIYGFNKEIIKDAEDHTVTYRQLIRKSFAFANLIAKDSQDKSYIGLMMNNRLDTIAIFYAMQACGRKPVMIDYTSSTKSIINACRVSSIKVMYISVTLIKDFNLQQTIEELLKLNIKVIYLEDLKNRMNIYLRCKVFIFSFLPQSYYNNICNDHDDNSPAVVLFNQSATEMPQAIVLSHQNLQANRYQLLAKIHFSPDDFVFIALPLFSCNGLAGALTSILNGIRIFIYPSPLDYRTIPELIYGFSITILLSTDKFLKNYAQYAHPYDFYSIRYVFAYSEKLQDETRQLWLDKFGTRIFEVYSNAAASPVISCNTPMHYRLDSVGRLMPKIEFHISQVAGIDDGGKLSIKGPNIMLGYMQYDNPGVICPTFSSKLGSGWYETDDIVKIDSEGYITFLGHKNVKAI